MNAIILAAGMGRRMQPMGWDSPKCLLPCPGGTLLDNTLNALVNRGVSRVAVVVGYQREQIEAAARKCGLHIDFVVNEDYATTNTLHSLYLAREYLLEGALLFNGDVWFRDGALDALAQDGDSALLVIRRLCGPEEVKVIVDQDDRVRRIGKDIDVAQAFGEFIGVARLDVSAGTALSLNLEQCVAAGESRQFFEFSLDQILDEHPIRAAFIDVAEAVEIDTPEDYLAAQTFWSA